MSQEIHESNCARPSGLHPLLRLLAWLAFGISATVTASVLIAKYQQPQPETTEPPFGPQKDLPKGLKELADKHFKNWPAGQTPDLVLFITGEQHNYIQPCGCTRPLYGGLERRFNLLETLRKHGLQVVAVDLGDLYYPGLLTEQARMKFKVSMKALNLMKYDALGIGREDFKYPLFDALAETVLNDKMSFRLLAANLLDRDVNFPAADGGSMIGETIITKSNLKVGIVGTIGKSQAALIQNDNKNQELQPKFGDNQKVLPNALQALKDADVHVLLYQGSYDEAKNIPAALPGINVIVCQSVESEPPAQPTLVDKTQIIRVGHKGRNIGVLSFFKKGEKYQAHYDLLLLGEEFETARPDEATNPLVQLMENYSKEVKAKDLRGKFAQMSAPHPLQTLFPKDNVAYVGSEKCKDCHKADYEIWSDSKHAVAFEALETKSRKPSLRQYDPECVICHTTGYGYRTGFVDETKTAHLLHVGCESCHGPGSAHVNKPKDPTLQLAMSPWKQKVADRLPDGKIEEAIDLKTCQKCHDVDNDPYFKFGKFWPKVAHGKGAKKK